jgi:hypothetical protein
MSLFFSNEEIQNTPAGLLQSSPLRVYVTFLGAGSQFLPIWQMPSEQNEIILKRGDYFLPGYLQAILWDLLPDQIRQYHQLGMMIYGRLQDERIQLYTGKKPWLNFGNEPELRAWAKAYSIRLPAQLDLKHFELNLPTNDKDMLPLEIIRRCEAIRTTGERLYRCHREAFHGWHCLFIGHHKEV